MKSFLSFAGKAALAAVLLVCAVAAIAAVDGEAFRFPFQPVGGRYESSPSTITDGEQDELRLTTAGLLRTSPEGTAAANLGKAEDAAHASADVGVMSLTVRTDTASARGGTDGDYQPLITDSLGRLHVTQGPAASVDANATITADVDAAVAASAGLRLVGFSARESAGSPAVATAFIVAGADADSGDTDLIKIELAANGSITQWFGPGGIDAAAGLSIDHVAGELEIVLFYVDTDQ